jgi:D-alanyl-D-alanine carboxypeptidase/D-alanyl-D-alanine-endopeptidase (penicillin-binding protein 4)
VNRSNTARRIVAGVLGVAAIGCIFAGVRESTDADATTNHAATAVASTAAPVWSPRRVPQMFVDGVGSTNLQRTLDGLAAGTQACFRVDVDGLGTVARGGTATSVIPASNAKVLTAAGSLGTLGPDSTFVTRTVARSASANGVVDQLWLVGGGDPVLSTPEWTAARESESEYAGLTATFTPLATLADSIVAAGIRAVPGGIVGDGSAYSTPTTLPTWKASYRTEIGPLGALVVDDGFDPVTREPVADPALAAATKLSEMLVARGVAVGPPTVGVAPAGGVDVASIRSAALAQLVTEMLSASDNGTAEGLALAVGKATTDTGTVPAGTAGILAALADAGVDLAGVTLVDGSGLSRENQVTCPALLETLALGRRPAYRSVVDGLAIAGRRGTLRERFVASPVSGRLWAKTGSLERVAALCGMFDVEDGTGTPRFATVFNGDFSEPGGRQLVSDAAEAIEAFPQSPPADQLVPAP